MEKNSHLHVQTVLPAGKNPGIQRMGGCVVPRGSQHVSGEERDFYCPYWVSMCINIGESSEINYWPTETALTIERIFVHGTNPDTT
jgi:hypothetical protein